MSRKGIRPDWCVGIHRSPPHAGHTGRRRHAARRSRPQRLGGNHRFLLSRRPLLYRVRAIRPACRPDAPQRRRPIDLFSICSPNYLHDAHCRFALRSDADAICEKPLVLNPVESSTVLAEIEQATGRRIFNILQLRLHPAVKALKAHGSIGPMTTAESTTWT